MSSLSISGKNWIFKKFSEENLSFIKENFFLDEITSKLISIRNIKKEDINSFLNPTIKNFLPNPNNLIDMEKSTIRTVEAIKQNEKIGIFGDYDVDGATSTALLGNYFSNLSLNYEIYIPDRKKEGYGPTIKSFEYFKKKKY
jgi:single-stranded-DNA-specific exonuclease